MAQLNLSHTLTAGTPENVNDVQDNFQDIVDHVNDALIGDDNLTSPNNSVWRPVFTVGGASIAGGTTAATYMLPQGSSGVVALASTGAYVIPMWHPVSADIAVAGKTTQVRVSANLSVNGTAPGVNFTVGLYPIATVTGATSSAMTYTLGTVVATASFTAPTASFTFRAQGSAASLPSVGSYVFGVVVSGTVATNSLSSLTARLEMRHN